MKAKFSIIIPSLNEEYFIQGILTSLQNETYTNIEVILVDACSSDNTVEIARSFQGKIPLKIITTKEKNVSISRNLGASKATGEFILFIDADNDIEANFLTTASFLIQNNDLITPSIIPDSATIWYKTTYKFVNSIILLGSIFKLSFSTGGNMLIRKTAFNKLKGFDKSLFVGEDHDIVLRAKNNKMKILYTNNLKVISSTRRLEKEGGALYLKYFYSTLHIALFGKMTKKMYNYEMGGAQYKKRG